MWPARYWWDVTRHTLGWNVLLHVSEQGRRTSIIPPSDCTLEAGLPALQGVRPQAEPSETSRVQLGLLASRLLWFPTEWCGPKQKAFHANGALLKIPDTSESLFLYVLNGKSRSSSSKQKYKRMHWLTSVQGNAASLLGCGAPGALCQAPAQVLSSPASPPTPHKFGLLASFSLVPPSALPQGFLSLHLHLHLPES